MDNAINLVEETDPNTTVILNPEFKLKNVKPITDEDWDKIFSVDVNLAIVYLLRKKAMTIPELHTKLYDAMNMLYEKECKVCDEYGKKRPDKEPTKIKSETTVWRYISKLQKAGYIAEAGRLYSHDTKSSKILY